MTESYGPVGSDTESRNGVIDRLKKHLAAGRRLSPKYSMLADYILQHPDEGAFSTAAELAQAANVSEATVIRFANALSYDSYGDFRRDFQRWMTDELTTIHRMQDSVAEPSRDDLLSQVLYAEIQNLEKTLGSVSQHDLELAANLMLDADELFVVGLRASAGLARYLAYEAAEIVPRVNALTTGGLDSIASVASCTSGLLIAFGFPRYPRETIEIIQAARQAGLSTIAITDSFTSPLAERSDLVLFTAGGSNGPVDLYSAPMAVASCIVLQAARTDQDRTLQGLANFERVAERVNLYWPTSTEQ